jgi:elongation factor Ts
MAITAAQVKELRTRTGAGMMDCKRALQDMDGDMDAAIDQLLKKGMAKAAKKAGRIAAEGLVGVFVADDLSVATLVEVNSETDFVARNDAFINFVADVAKTAHEGGFTDIDAFKAFEVSAGKTVDDWIKEQIAAIGENLNIRRVVRLGKPEAIVGSYIHAGAQIGVLVEVGIKGADGDTAATFARDVAMHVAASSPLFLRTSDIPDADVAKQTEILTAQAQDSGKPADIIAKMVEGRVRKWKAEFTLLEQPFVKDPDVTISQHQKRTGGVELLRFVRFQVGEGIEKEEKSFADEVAELNA